MTEPATLQRWLELSNPGSVLVDLPGPFDLQSYGLMMAAAFAAGGWLGQREMDRRGLPGAEAWSLVVWAAVGGLVGSRILAIFDRGILDDPIGWLLTGGVYTFYGGLVGGFVTVSLAMRAKGLPWLRTVDCIAPSLAIGQALGRVGCQLSGDGDWGRATTLPWGMTYPNAQGGWPEAAGVLVHPTPLYEALAYGGVFAYLWATRARARPPGSLLWLYLILVPAFRFAIEFWRINPPVLGPLSQAQVVSLVLMTIGGVQWARGRSRSAALRSEG
ncbi:MAG: prolipoprotein diacylglyceryl transferase [Myxococcales bacterium]|nr:prolipoprotein diacylglyceryl transferase [Myxococcales bacterium]